MSLKIRSLYTFRIIAYSFETIFQAVGCIDNGTASLGDDGSNIEIIEGPVLIPKVRSFIFFCRFLPYFSRSVSHFFANTFNFIFFRQNTGTGSQTNVGDFSIKLTDSLDSDLSPESGWDNNHSWEIFKIQFWAKCSRISLWLRLN